MLASLVWPTVKPTTAQAPSSAGARPRARAGARYYHYYYFFIIIIIIIIIIISSSSSSSSGGGGGGMIIAIIIIMISTIALYVCVCVYMKIAGQGTLSGFPCAVMS